MTKKREARDARFPDREIKYPQRPRGPRPKPDLDVPTAAPKAQVAWDAVASL